MQTDTSIREAETARTHLRRGPGSLGGSTEATSGLSLAALLAASELTSDSTSVHPASPRAVVVQTNGGTAPPAAPPTPPSENDFLLCQLGPEGIEATYPGPLVAQMALRYSASCPQSDGGEAHAALD